MTSKEEQRKAREILESYLHDHSLFYTNSELDVIVEAMQEYYDSKPVGNNKTIKFLKEENKILRKQLERQSPVMPTKEIQEKLKEIDYLLHDAVKSENDNVDKAHTLVHELAFELSQKKFLVMPSEEDFKNEMIKEFGATDSGEGDRENRQYMWGAMFAFDWINSKIGNKKEVVMPSEEEMKIQAQVDGGSMEEDIAYENGFKDCYYWLRSQLQSEDNDKEKDNGLRR